MGLLFPYPEDVTRFHREMSPADRLGRGGPEQRKRMPKKFRSPIAMPSTQVPMPCKVQEDADLRPVAVSLEGKTLEVVSIDERE